MSASEAINKYIRVVLGSEPLNESAYNRAVDALYEYNQLFREEEGAADEWIYTLSAESRRDLGKLFGAVKRFISDIIYAKTSKAGDSERDAAVNLALMWPGSYDIVNDPKFSPSRWSEELYPSIEHPDEVEKQISITTRSHDLDTKSDRMDSLVSAVKSKPGVDKDVMKVLVIQAELINQLLREQSELQRRLERMENRL